MRTTRSTNLTNRFQPSPVREKTAPKKVSYTLMSTVNAGYDPIEKTTDQTPTISIKHNWYPLDSVVQSYVNYAWKISWWDIDFISTLEAENWQWNHTRQSEVRTNWVREESYWFCQMMKKWHKEVSDERFWSDPYWQLDICWYKYKNGTRFYWYDVRHKVKNRFAFIN